MENVLQWYPLSARYVGCGQAEGEKVNNISVDKAV